LDKTSKPAHHRPNAYQDTRFLESKDARALRILAEYMESLYRLQRHKVDDTIVFMGSARLRSEEAAMAALAEAERAGRASRSRTWRCGFRSITRRRERSLSA
jgi:hypothetical protein